MQKMIKEYFLPSNNHNCKERNRSMDQYMKELYRLHTRNNMDEPELRIVIKYIDRLRHEILNEIMDTIWDLGSTIAWAKKLEERGNKFFLKNQQQQLISEQNKPSGLRAENK